MAPREPKSRTAEQAGAAGAALPTENLEAFRPHRKLEVRRFHLRVAAGPDAGRVHLSRGERVVVGTHRAADFPLRDPAVSRFHFEITLREGAAAVRDLSSKNGTRVSGVAVFSAPLSDGDLLAVGRSELRFELSPERLEIPLSRRERFGLMVGRSAATRAVFAVLERAAESDLPVLLCGETGTGKDLAARSVHMESARKAGPFVVVDCGAISQSLLESELFGHVRGAFTGADRARDGAFQAASGGTLFLDEIGELPADLQPKLLRALDTHEVQAVGASARRKVDIRVVAATNRNLRAEVNERRFRADLFHRFAVLEVTIPPLRDRHEDLPLLVDEIVSSLGATEAQAATLRGAAFVAELGRHAWHGNVRELRNWLTRRLALGSDAGAAGPEQPFGVAPAIDVTLPLREVRERWIEHLDRRYLTEILEKHGGNVSEAARAAGVGRGHFYRMLGRLGLR